MAIVYCITCKPTMKMYVGKSDLKQYEQSPLLQVRRRFSQHFNYAKAGRKGDLYDDMRRLPREDFEYRILEVLPSHANSLEREKYWIHKLKSHLTGYNFLDSGTQISDFSLRRISTKLKGDPRLATCPMLGKSHTPESLEKMRNAKLGKVMSAEQKARISKSLIGKNLNKGGKKIFCEDNGKTYPTASEAARQLGIPVLTVSRIATGFYKTGKFKLKYIE